MTIKEILKESIENLKKEKVENPVNIARIILANTLKVNKEYLIVHDNEEIIDNVKKQYQNDLESFINGKPLQYITNHQEFMQMDFYVDENVLIPRQDTEILVEEIISISKKINKNIKILDLCTGSGCIGISLAKKIENAEVYASDISKNALQVAIKNAKNNNVKINYIESNLFENIDNIKFDIIVSNPPYIEKNTILNLPKDVQNEPKIALDGGVDGLDFYRKIIEEATKYLKTDGYLCFEIGYNQKESVCNLLKNNKNYKEIYSKKDLFNNDRIVIARYI